MRRAALAGLLTVAACSYHPAPQVNTQSPAYQKDLDACEDQSATQVNATNAKRALSWFASPVRRWGQIADATRDCMTAKGYGALRWCTAAELRDGQRQGSVVVTAAGLQCSDPPAAQSH